MKKIGWREDGEICGDEKMWSVKVVQGRWVAFGSGAA